MFSPSGVAFITGAGGAVGQATCIQFARDGVTRISGLDISKSGLEATASILSKDFPNVKFHPVVLDLTVEAEVQRAVNETVATFGRLDYAVNNAGVAQRLLPTTGVTLDEYNKLMDINIKAVYLCEKYELMQMLTQDPLPANELHRNGSRGTIVNVASIAGFLAMPSLSLYTMSKHAVIGLTRSDALDYAKDGIRVNAICPGYIDTPLNTSTNREFLKERIATIPARRLASPGEIADSITFLAGERSTYITGTSLVVDGGYAVQ
ncbi:uncharacterized protein JN550_011921 [Neoarthrinium moseri]|uniref:uncharacterized protein n=1 Tax=Neoarthrinium moseri TaxID=1658444 RepID=UPI001FDC588B|nr:uncharacterized protein JN550_011921 [Neoarthrinium moseri]KAI1859613.1 hypothetical protein JN550_011921 [Neoarthrinium moseri]